MGEIAEMMLDGTLCEACGAFLDDSEGDSPGFPCYCSEECAKSRDSECDFPDNGVVVPSFASYPVRPFRCPDCKGRFKTRIAAEQHARDKAHGAPMNEGRPEKDIPCHLCAKKFRSFAAVNDHLRQKHGVTIEETDDVAF